MMFALAMSIVLGVSAFFLLPQFWSGELGDPADDWTKKLLRRRNR